MKICAIIAEFNPFHNGHAYLIDKVRSSGYTHVIVVMSGNFVQRGEPAIFPKETRAEIALESGVDLVIELPTIKTTLTAEKYAYSAVELINNLKCVNALVFGSECGNIYELSKVNECMLHESFDVILKEYLKNGITFALARERAVCDIAKDRDVSSVLKTPNNILGIEYLKAISKLDSKLKCLTFKRIKDLENIKSATEIRNMIFNGDMSYKKYIPYNSCSLIDSALKKGIGPVNMFSMSRIVISKLRQLSLENISELPDISEGLEHRIYNSIRECCSLEELLFKIKTKRYTMSRIKRILLNAFLGIDSDISSQTVKYLKILATNSNGLKILKEIKKSTDIPIITRYSQLNTLTSEAKSFFDLESNFTDIYNTLTPNILPCGIEKKFKLIRSE